MKLRQALIEQAPSLALQRAAADEIARLDAALERTLAEADGWHDDARGGEAPGLDDIRELVRSRHG